MFTPGSVEYKRACWVRRPADVRLPDPRRRRAWAWSEYSDDTDSRAESLRYGWLARCLRIERAPVLALVP